MCRETTEEEFRKFRRHCEHYVNLFGLTDWDVGYVMKEIDSYANACIETQPGLRKALISLQLYDLETEFNDLEIIALHEVLELLLSDFGDMAQGKLGSEIIENETHRIINRLINAWTKE